MRFIEIRLFKNVVTPKKITKVPLVNIRYSSRENIFLAEIPLKQFKMEFSFEKNAVPIFEYVVFFSALCISRLLLIRFELDGC